MATEDEEFADERYAGDADDGRGTEESGEETEGLPGGRIPNPPPRDAWISRVVEDPANPPAAVLLSGYVGDAAEEGRTRIYTDPSLASYVEVQDEDVLHHEALGGDQVPEGGSMVWVRTDAVLRPGGGAGNRGGDFFTGPVLEQNRKAGDAQRGLAPTMLMAGCHTRLLGCTVWACPTQIVLCNTALPIVCSHVCHQGGGIGLPGGRGGRDPEGTYACPSFGCPTNVVDCGGLRPIDQGYPVGTPRVAMAAGAQGEKAGPTGYFHCGEIIGQTGWQGCGQQEQGAVGVTGWQGCGQQGPIGVTGWQGCGLPHISLPGCIHTGTCSAVDACPTRLCAPGEGTDTVQAAAGGAIGITGWQGCGQPPISLPGCIHTGTCPTRLIGCTGYPGCGPHISLPGCIHTGTCPSAIDACPTRACAGEGADTVQAAAAGRIGQTGWLGCGQPHISLPGCVHTGTCPIGHTGWLGCGQPHISLPGCVHTGTCPSAVDACPTRICGGGGGEQVNPQAMMAAAPGGQQAAVPTTVYGPQCPTFGFTCTYVHCPPQTAATVCTQVGCQAQPGAEQAAVPTTVYGPQCPTFGFTCTYVHCPPQTVATVCTQVGCQTQQCTLPPGCPPPTGPGATIATVCTQIDCPSFGFTCTAFCQAQPGGGAEAQRQPQGFAAAAPGGGAQAAATFTPNCPTLGFTCTYVHCPQGGAGGGVGGGGAAAATYQLHCPTLGFTCTYVHCPQGGAGGGLGGAMGGGAAAAGPSTAATVCTQFGCPRTSTCPPTFQPGCGPDHEHGGSTAATLCTQAPFCPPTVICPPVTMIGCGGGGGRMAAGVPQTFMLGCPQTSTCPRGY